MCDRARRKLVVRVSFDVDVAKILAALAESTVDLSVGNFFFFCILSSSLTDFGLDDSIYRLN